jgi:hypothetical protein
MVSGTKLAGAAALLIAVVVPPAVAGGLGQEFVAHHAAWAVAIGVVYEAAVMAGGFFAVVARDVSSRWQKRIADQVDQFLQRKTARFDRRYREFVLGGLRFMDHKGLATVGPFTPELDAVFVDVSLVPRPPQRIGRGILPDLADERAGRRVLGDFLGRKKPAVLAVVGGPGSGKTTLLRHAAREAYLRRHSRHDRRNQVRDIPILLYLRDHAAAITSDPNVSLATLVRKSLGEAGTDEPPQWFEQQLRDGRCLVLLDGLDEVARQDDRAKVSTWAEGQILQYPGNDFVISSRPQGYQSAPVGGAAIVQVCGFTSMQVEAFVRGWYRAAERHSTGTDGAEAEALANQGADDLLKRLEHAPALYDLTVNPLLLTMIVNVHRYRGSLPGSRAELYGEICTVMLSRRQDAKNLPQQLAGDKKESVLRGLACSMMRRRVTDWSRDEVLANVGAALRRVSRDATPDGFLDDVSSNGLLIERETGKYAFAHKTFQEYLAAEHIRVNGLVGELANTVSDDWWVETTLLYAATSNADRIVRACLDANTGPALALALDCTDQDSDVDPKLRERVNELVVSDAGPGADQSRRRLFAGILLARHMRQRERTARGSQICTRPVPAEIYRLFLADTGTPEPDAPLAKSGVAVGMRGDDAVAFVQWASSLHPEHQNYRLPLAVELADLATQQRIPALPSGQLPCVWTQKEASLPEHSPVLCRLPGVPDPYEFTGALLGDSVSGDVDRVPFLLSTLLLQSHILVRILDRVLDRVLIQAGNPDSAYALTDIHNLAQNFTHNFTSVRNLPHNLIEVHEFSRNLANAQELQFKLVSYLALTFALTGNRTPVLAHDVEQARNLAGDLSDILARILCAAPLRTAVDLTGGIDAAVNQNLRSISRPDEIQLLDGNACRLVMGRAFSMALTETLVSSSQPDDRNARFAQSFASATRVSTTERFTTKPATLAAIVQQSLAQLSVPLELGPPARPSPWAPVAARRLRQWAQPVLARTVRLTPERATSIRMTALCLAAEADDLKQWGTGDMFRQVAAGITFLERRLSGEQEATEVIMLALDQHDWYRSAKARSEETAGGIG